MKAISVWASRTALTRAWDCYRHFDGVQTDYTYDAANRMLTAGNSTFTYDDKGNTLTETNGSVVTTYTWDCLNRLTQWQKTGETTQAYVYNADGMRVRVTPSGGTATDFLLDGLEIAEEIASVGVTSYVGPGLISSISGTARTIYHADGLGSTRAMSDGSQLVSESGVYDAYGNAEVTYGTAPSFGYAGQYRYYADATRLYYLKARYYDPVTGRFLSRDPIGYEEDPNLYRYAYSKRTCAVDPDGRGLLDLIDCIRCFWYWGRVLKALRECRDEIMYDSDRCFESGAERNKAIIDCAENKMGKPGLVTNVMKWCANCGFKSPWPGPNR